MLDNYLMCESGPQSQSPLSSHLVLSECARVWHRNLWPREQGLTFFYTIKSLGAILPSDVSKQIIAFSEADWASERTDSRFVSGFVIKCNGSIMFYKSKKQTLIAMSSLEAEYIALVSTVKQVLYLWDIVKFLRQPLKHQIQVYCDNHQLVP